MSREVYQFHPLCSVFPLQDKGKDWDDFVEDIRKHGVLEPIVVFNNQIIDGRRRYRAATISRAPYKIVEWSGTDQELRLYLWSKNGNRRHLTAVQRALIFLELFPRSKSSHRRRISGQSPKVYQRALALRKQGVGNTRIAAMMNSEGLHSITGKPWTHGSISSLLSKRAPGEPPITPIAKIAGLPPPTVLNARQLRDANPQLAEQVKNGDLSFQSAAEMSGHPALTQMVKRAKSRKQTSISACTDEEQRIKWAALLLKTIQKQKLNWRVVPLNDLIQYMADIKGLKRELDEEQDRVHAEILRRPQDLQEGGQIA